MVRCSVLGCQSDSGRKIDGLSFHSFHATPEIRNLWIEATKRTNWVPNKNSKICSQHFHATSFMKVGNKSFLNPKAVPLEVIKSSNPLTFVKPVASTSAIPEIEIGENIPTTIQHASGIPFIKVTSGPSLAVQGNISLGSDFNPVITDIQSAADLIKQEGEDPQSDDTLSLADDADQSSDADQPSEELIPLSNAQVPLRYAPDPLSDVKVEEVEFGVNEVEVTRPVEETRPVVVTRAVEETRPVELTRLVDEIRPVEETRADEEPTVPLPLHLKHELSRAGNNCYNLIRIQANQINKLSVRCGKQRLKLHSYAQLVRHRDKRISYLRAEVEALRSFIEECGWEASSSGGGKKDMRSIQIRNSNNVVGQKKPNRQLLIVKRDYKPKSSVSAQHTSDTQTSTVGAKREADSLLKSLLDSLQTSDNRRKSSAGVKRTIYIQEKSSVSIPATSDILQKSSVGVKRTSDILQRSSSGIPATSDVLQNSIVGVKRTLDARQKSSVSIPDTSDVLQKSTGGVKRPLNIQEKSSVSIPGTSDGLPKSTVGVKRTLNIRQKSSSGTPSTSNFLQKSTGGVKRLNIQEKSSVSIPGTSDVLQKSTDGVKRISDIKNNPSIAIQPVSVVPQTSVGLQRTSEVRQNALFIQIDGMHNTLLQPKLVRLDDNSMETG